MLATALAPVIGYDDAAKLAKEAQERSHDPRARDRARDGPGRAGPAARPGGDDRARSRRRSGRRLSRQAARWHRAAGVRPADRRSVRPRLARHDEQDADRRPHAAEREPDPGPRDEHRHRPTTTSIPIAPSPTRTRIDPDGRGRDHRDGLRRARASGRPSDRPRSTRRGPAIHATNADGRERRSDRPIARPPASTAADRDADAARRAAGRPRPAPQGEDLERGSPASPAGRAGRSPRRRATVHRPPPTSAAMPGTRDGDRRMEPRVERAAHEVSPVAAPARRRCRAARPTSSP